MQNREHGSTRRARGQRSTMPEGSAGVVCLYWRCWQQRRWWADTNGIEAGAVLEREGRKLLLDLLTSLVRLPPRTNQVSSSKWVFFFKISNLGWSDRSRQRSSEKQSQIGARRKVSGHLLYKFAVYGPGRDLESKRLAKKAAWVHHDLLTRTRLLIHICFDRIGHRAILILTGLDKDTKAINLHLFWQVLDKENAVGLFSEMLSLLTPIIQLLKNIMERNGCRSSGARVTVGWQESISIWKPAIENKGCLMSCSFSHNKCSVWGAPDPTLQKPIYFNMNLSLLGGVDGPGAVEILALPKQGGGSVYWWIRLSQPKLIPTPIYALFIGCRESQLHRVDA